MESGGDGDDDGGAVTNGIEVTKADRSDAVTVNIWCSNGTKFAVQVSLESSVESFKSVLEQSCDIPTEKQILVYKGRILKNDHILKSYEHTVHLLARFPPATESDNTANIVEEETMGGSSSSSHITLFNGYPEFEEVQRQYIQNRNMPMTPERMYSLMNKRHDLLNTIRNNPQLTEVVNRDSYLSSVVNDPVKYCRRVEAMICSEFIREMIRYEYRRLGGSATPDIIDQLTQNPATSQMIRTILSNPQNLLNPQSREMTQNPVFNRKLTLPETIQQMMALQQSLSSQICQQQSIRRPSQTGEETGSQSNEFSNSDGGEANDDGEDVTSVIEVTKAGGSDTVTINIRCSNGTKFAVPVRLESSVKSFRFVLEQNCNIPTEKRILVYKGRILNNDQTLTNYGLEADHTVHVVGDFPPTKSDNTTNTSDGSSPSSYDSSEFDLEPIQQWWSHRMTPDWIYRLMNNPDDILDMIRNSPELMEEVNRDPYLPSIINDSINFRKSTFESIIYAELCREMMRYVYRHHDQEILESLLSHPHDIITMRGTIAQLLNPRIIEMIRNPRSTQMASPETIQQMIAWQQSLSSQIGQQQSTREPSQTGGGTDKGPGTGGSTTPNNNSNVGPEEVYASQLAQLQELGFSDTTQNLEALIATSGNVPEAIDRLLGNHRGQ